jgi:hypothetical protein
MTRAPLTPEQVRSLCSRLGITAQRPLSEAEVKRMASNKPNGIHSVKQCPRCGTRTSMPFHTCLKRAEEETKGRQ